MVSPLRGVYGGIFGFVDGDGSSEGEGEPGANMQTVDVSEGLGDGKGQPATGGRELCGKVAATCKRWT